MDTRKDKRTQRKDEIILEDQKTEDREEKKRNDIMKKLFHVAAKNLRRII